MKIVLGAVFAACLVFVNLAFGGSAAVGSQLDAAATMPACDWRGLYLGLHAGGQFGQSTNTDLDNYNFPNRSWDYDQSGFVGGEQIGYNWQVGRLLLGLEVDGGYMRVHGRGLEPGFPGDTFGESDSDFYATFRGRVGVTAGRWLFYATGGAIGVNDSSRVVDRSFTTRGPDTIDASREDFRLGYTVGGGAERMFAAFGRCWSVKVEYLYFNVDDETFSAVSDNGFGPYRFRGGSDGNILRVGVNYHF